mgnify:CR=1 FL=1
MFHCLASGHHASAMVSQSVDLHSRKFNMKTMLITTALSSGINLNAVVMESLKLSIALHMHNCVNHTQVFITYKNRWYEGPRVRLTQTLELKENLGVKQSVLYSNFINESFRPFSSAS